MEKREQIGKRRWKLPVCLLILGMTAWLVMSRWPQDRNLLERSQRVSSVSGWDQDGHLCYSWLSDHEVVFVRSHKNAKGAKEFRAFKLYTMTEQETAYPEFDKPKFYKATYEIATFENVSPDGAWLHLADGGSSSRIHYFVPLGKKGSKRTIVNSTREYEELLWRGSGHQLLKIQDRAYDGSRTEKKDRTFSIDLENPNARREVPLSGNMNIGALCGGVVCRATTDDHLVILMNEIDNRTWHIQKWRLGVQIGSKQIWTILAPQGSEGEPAIAPQGNLLAWLVTAEYTTPLDKWLHRIFKKYQPHTIKRVGIWVCCLDGSNLHETGHLETMNKSDSLDTSESLDQLQWLPDGKQISFVHDDALYVVKAE